MDILFPSGQKKTISERPPRDQPARPIKGPPSRKPQHPCAHIGAPLKITTGCSGVHLTSTWSCPLHGVCAPLAVKDIKQPGVTVCKLCPDHTPAAEPGWTKLGVNFLSAIARWKKAGSPQPTPELVAQRLATCRACPFLMARDTAKQHCGKCGCSINDSLRPTQNKLAMPTESCPLDEPLWVAVTS
jgi:hypothetical protein